MSSSTSSPISSAATSASPPRAWATTTARSPTCGARSSARRSICRGGRLGYRRIDEGETSTMATAETTDGLTDVQHAAELRKAVFASTIGTTIEWYDFFLYGTAAGLVFGKLYFPNEHPLTATLAAFSTYFIG